MKQQDIIDSVVAILTYNHIKNYKIVIGRNKITIDADKNVWSSEIIKELNSITKNYEIQTNFCNSELLQ